MLILDTLRIVGTGALAVAALGVCCLNFFILVSTARNRDKAKVSYVPAVAPIFAAASLGCTLGIGAVPASAVVFLLLEMLVIVVLSAILRFVYS